jgi:uncharacterized protein
MTLADKHRQLTERLRALGRVAVAYSGGVDSTYLLKAATEVLGADNALGLTAESPSLPASELELSGRIAQEHGLRQVVVQTHEAENPDYAANPVNRCYFCKSEMFTVIAPIARGHGFEHILIGANADDTGDWRPGHQAAQERGVLTPLLDAGLTKADVRKLAREAGLENWDKPAAACLASRFPYGTEVTPERLGMIERAEEFLRTEVGLGQHRVRWQDGGARIESMPGEMQRVIEASDAIHRHLTEIGFKSVSLDLRGYRQGSLNEGLVQIATDPH